MSSVKIIMTETFEKGFCNLEKTEQKQARKALRFLLTGPTHQSLHIHRIKGTIYWEAYVNMDIRLIFEQEDEVYVLHAIGHHDILIDF